MLCSLVGTRQVCGSYGLVVVDPPGNTIWGDRETQQQQQAAKQMRIRRIMRAHWHCFLRVQQARGRETTPGAQV